ncbi:MAG: alpha/beta fold hydrolase [Rhizomicrobium sp.]
MKPDLLLLPGMLCDAAFWSAQTAALADIRATRVAHYGLAGSIEAMAETVLRDAPEVFDLAGHSMGGRVAQEIVRRAPARVRRLALFATDYRGHADDPARDAEAAQRDETLARAREIGIAAWAAEWAREMVAPERLEDRALLSAVAAMFARCTLDQLAAHAQAGLTRPDYSDLLPRIACPALVCAGSEDRLRTVEAHRAMAALIPGARLVVLDRCGHMVAMERPDAVTAAMREWLSR